MKRSVLIIAVLALSFNSVYALAKPTNLKIEYVKPYEIKDNKIKVIVSWKHRFAKPSPAKGYAVLYKTSKKGKWKPILTTKKHVKVNALMGKRFYVRVASVVASDYHSKFAKKSKLIGERK